MQRQHIAEAEGAVALGKGRNSGGAITGLAQLWLANWQPFVVGLQGGVATQQPIALSGALVILGTTCPAVIGGFVVVPDGNQRRGGTHCLEIGIGVVLGIALAVVVEANDFAVWQETTAAGSALRLPIAARTIFIDVIT